MKCILYGFNASLLTLFTCALLLLGSLFTDPGQNPIRNSNKPGGEICTESTIFQSRVQLNSIVFAEGFLYSQGSKQETPISLFVPLRASSVHCMPSCWLDSAQRPPGTVGERQSQPEINVYLIPRVS